jgi:hypothetical protein
MNTHTWITKLSVLAGVSALALLGATPAESNAMSAPVAGRLQAVADAGGSENGLQPADDPPDQPKPAQGEKERRPHDPPPGGEGGPRPEGPTAEPPGPGLELPGGPPGLPPEEMMGRAMEILRNKLPGLHTRLLRLQRRNPERFAQTMHRVMPIVMEYLALRDKNPKLAESIFEEFRIEEKLRQLSRKFAEASAPEQKDELGKEIEKLVRQQLDLRQERAAARLEEFERRIREQQRLLEEQRVKLAEEKKNHDELIARRIEEVKQGKVSDLLRPPGGPPGGPPGEMRRRMQRGPGGPPGPGNGPPMRGPQPEGKDRPQPPDQPPGDREEPEEEDD